MLLLFYAIVCNFLPFLANFCHWKKGSPLYTSAPPLIWTPFASSWDGALGLTNVTPTPLMRKHFGPWTRPTSPRSFGSNALTRLGRPFYRRSNMRFRLAAWMVHIKALITGLWDAQPHRDCNFDLVLTRTLHHRYPSPWSRWTKLDGAKTFVGVIIMTCSKCGILPITMISPHMFRWRMPSTRWDNIAVLGVRTLTQRTGNSPWSLHPMPLHCWFVLLVQPFGNITVWPSGPADRSGPSTGRLTLWRLSPDDYGWLPSHTMLTISLVLSHLIPSSHPTKRLKTPSNTLASAWRRRRHSPLALNRRFLEWFFNTRRMLLKLLPALHEHSASMHNSNRSWTRTTWTLTQHTGLPASYCSCRLQPLVRWAKLHLHPFMLEQPTHSLILTNSWLMPYVPAFKPFWPSLRMPNHGWCLLSTMLPHPLYIQMHSFDKEIDTSRWVRAASLANGLLRNASPTSMVGAMLQQYRDRHIMQMVLFPAMYCNAFVVGEHSYTSWKFWPTSWLSMAFKGAFPRRFWHISTTRLDTVQSSKDLEEMSP